MRIAHVTDCYLPRLGGIEMQVHDLATRQRAAGHETTVITQTPESAESGTSRPGPAVGRAGSPAPIAQRAVRPFIAGFSASDLLTPRALRPGARARLADLTVLMLPRRAASHAGVPTVGHRPLAVGAHRSAHRYRLGHRRAHRWPVVWSAVSQTAAGQVGQDAGQRPRGRRAPERDRRRAPGDGPGSSTAQHGHDRERHAAHAPQAPDAAAADAQARFATGSRRSIDAARRAHRRRPAARRDGRLSPRARHGELGEHAGPARATRHPADLPSLRPVCRAGRARVVRHRRPGGAHRPDCR